MKKLVAYYSLAGNTKFIAEKIAKTINADLLEIKPNKELNSNSSLKYLWAGKQVLMKSKPELKPLDKNPADYDAVLIGTPVWACNFTSPIRSFFSNTNLQNKKIAVFCTHGGGSKNTLENMKTELTGNTFLGEIGFLNVLKNKEQTTGEAEKWSKSLSLK